MPGAVWLLFGFGVTLAPLIEEIAYRGFLLPAMCAAYDWAMERITGSLARPDDNGRPRWTTSAMVVSSLITSVPFALMHGDQTSYALGPLLLLILREPCPVLGAPGDALPGGQRDGALEL